MNNLDHFPSPDASGKDMPDGNLEHKTVEPERPPIEIDRILTSIRDSLPVVATDLVKVNLDMSHPFNRALAENPDDPDEHAPRWHQYGILTHSEKFRHVIANEARTLTQEWGVGDRVATQLNETIDGTPKEDLLQVASLLHDVGKYTARELKLKEGAVKPSRFYADHEAHSGAIIRYGFKEGLTGLGLDEQQIEYVAKCAELHFELGKVRRAARDTGYSMVFADSEACTQAIQGIIAEHPDYALEIGLMFIADNLSKTEVMATPGTDVEIQQQRPALEAEIARRGLNPKLVDQALVEPVNMAVAGQYFQVWSSMR